MENNVEEHTFEIRKTVRYCVAKPLVEPSVILVVLHGYRQLAKYFIKHFLPLTDEGVLLLAPEGLHRFYIEGYHGKVGASWMTKEARLDDIADYTCYLNDVIASIGHSHLPKVLLGFSQGGATACRLLSTSSQAWKGLILHGSVFPDDFDFDAQHNQLKQTPVHLIFGDSDQFASEEVIEQKMLWLKEHKLSLELHRFVGGHEIHLDSVRAAMQRLQLL